MVESQRIPRCQRWILLPHLPSPPLPSQGPAASNISGKKPFWKGRAVLSPCRQDGWLWVQAGDRVPDRVQGHAEKWEKGDSLAEEVAFAILAKGGKET